ncbi:hypothetical protein [Nonomuraea sp. SYSU D8015]|uniref:hypothetical protein n=1 Tax=Nonomuraea sp. SYSU D8015 TaxID=2593644 RepID=UPI001CB6D742|nr:hypothetical protein [Nonomuraea sp. SYSU D8015]
MGITVLAIGWLVAAADIEPRAALDAQNPAIGQRLPALSAALIQHTTVGQYDDGDGLLTGAAGVGLALETVRHITPPRSGWDACLLIA